MDVYKGKIQFDVSLDELELIIVVRRDLQNKELVGDTWSPTASMELEGPDKPRATGAGTDPGCRVCYARDRVFHFIPEPRNFVEVKKLSDNIKKPWLKANLKEIKNLINNKTFLI